MKLISVNVGLPREITVGGKTVKTSIWKNPVQGRVHVSTLNLEGDQQSDLSVHGGIDKAVYLYPGEHYSYWRTQLPDVDLTWGAFGENFSTAGILAGPIKDRDRIRVGSAGFMVSQALLVIVFVDVDRFLGAGHHFNRHVVIAPIFQDDEATLEATQDEIEGKVAVGHRYNRINRVGIAAAHHVSETLVDDMDRLALVVFGGTIVEVCPNQA